MADKLTYRAQFEIIDPGFKLSDLKVEARQRMIEDILKLGMRLIGESTEPQLLELEGRQWIQLEGQVQDAGQLLQGAG